MLEEKRVFTPITGEWTVHRNALTFVFDYFHKLINMLVLADLYIILCVVCIFVSFTEQENSCFFYQDYLMFLVFFNVNMGEKRILIHTQRYIRTHSSLMNSVVGTQVTMVTSEDQSEDRLTKMVIIR